jgi:adenine-specific DNA glycosylase
VEVRETAVVVRKGPRVLLVRRPDDGRWSGMWEFPRSQVEEGESHERAAARFLPALTGIQADLAAELLTIRHTVTHHRIALVCFEAAYLRGEYRSHYYQDARWVFPRRLKDFPVSRPQRRLADLLVAPARQRSLF